MTKQTQTFERSTIEETAATLVDIATAQEVPHTKDILEHLTEIAGEIKSLCPALSWIVASRHRTTRRLLNSLSKDYQIVEMGSGFSPHGLNYASKFTNWTEIDLPFNSKSKEQITSKIDPKCPVKYIPGNIFEKSTWNEVKDNLDLSKPVFVFCEGVVSHYANEEQKDKLAEYLRDILVNSNSRLLLDDTLKNHPEFDNDSRILSARKSIENTLNKTSYSSKPRSTLKTERASWETRGFNIEMVPYESYPGFEEITSQLYGLLCSYGGKK